MAIVGSQAFPSAAFAQDDQPASFDAQFDDLFLMPDRSQLQWMRRAEQEVSEERYSNAVRFLAQILDSESDFFIRGSSNTNGETFTSFKRKAEQMIGDLPPEGLKVYDTLFSSAAERMLVEAVGSGEIDKLVECSRRYFHTSAGARASWLLGLHYLDHGQPLTAATILQRLQGNAAASELEPQLSLMVTLALMRAGRNDSAKATAITMRRNHPNARFTLGKRTIPIFANENRALDWLAGIGGRSATTGNELLPEWLLPNGNPSANPIVDADRPVSIASWRLPTASSEETLKKIARLEGEFASQSPPAAVLPGAQPLAVGDYILVRTLDALIAVDFKTGKRAFPISMESQPDMLPTAIALFGADPSSLDYQSLEQKLMDDMSYSLISSDGEAVYFVASADHQRTSSQLFMPTQDLSGSGALSGTNWLEARDLTSDGKLLWTLGGPPTAGNPLAGALFLGPPFPLDGVLYCLVEWEGAIELVAIQPRAENGAAALLWKQHLAAVDQRYGYDFRRRLAGAMPSFSDGFLICPTSAGAVVTVDLSTKSLQWGFKYAEGPGIYSSSAQQIYVGGRRGGRADRWVDTTARIENGRVYLTPPFSDRLYCLDLLTGDRLWEVARERGLYIAATTDEAVFVVGTRSLNVYKVADGSLITELMLPSGVTPSGRGLQTQDQYLLPLGNGEIATIDLKKCEISGRIPLRGIPGMDRPTLGNLIAYQGSIISQSLQSVDCFYQLDSLQKQSSARLAADPLDADALTNQAIVKLESGERLDAIELLQKSLDHRGDELTRILLVNSLRAIIREDFAANRDLKDRVRAMLTTDDERRAFFNDIAEGLYSTGEYLSSFQVYLDLADLIADQPPSVEPAMRSPKTNWQVREDRYLGARIMNLYAMADRADQARMDESIEARLPQRAAESGAGDRPMLVQQSQRLRHFINCFPGHHLANVARLRLASTIGMMSPDDIEMELLLRHVWRTGEPEQKTIAITELTSWYLHAKDIDLARQAAAALDSHLAEVAEADGVPPATTNEIAELQRRVAAAAATDPLLADWGDWDLVPPLKEDSGVMLPAIPMADDGSSLAGGIDAAGEKIFWDTSTGNILQRDAHGEVDWTLTVDNRIGVRRATSFLAYRFQRLGQLRLVTMEDSLFAIRTDDNTAELLGQSSFAGPVISARSDTVSPTTFRHPWGASRVTLQDQQGNSLGAFAIANEECLCLLRGMDVVAMHPTLTGNVLWQNRINVKGERLFASEERLYVVHGEKATVLRVADGEILGERDVPVDEETVATVGDGVVHWMDDFENPIQIALIDCWRGTKDRPSIVWQREFAASSKAQRLGEEQLLLMEPSGKLFILDLRTGETDLELQLNPEPGLNNVYAMPDENSLVVIANTSENFNQERSVIVTLPDSSDSVRVNGWLYGIDLDGKKKTWERRIGNHGIWLGQPSGLPVLAMACAANMTRKERQLRSNAVLVLEKSTGVIIHEDNDTMTASRVFQVSGDPRTGVIEFDLAGLPRLKFQFEPSAAREPEKRPE